MSDFSSFYFAYSACAFSRRSTCTQHSLTSLLEATTHSLEQFPSISISKSGSERRLLKIEMSQNVSVCDIDPTLKEDLRKFRFRKATTNAAIIMKVDREKQLIFKEEELEDIDVDELREALPEHQPRFLVYSFKLDHGDGRISYPMCFIFSSPQDSKTELQMMYAGSKLELVKVAELTKVFEIRELEELTEEWLHSKLLK